MLHSPRHPATAANSASESSGPVESNAGAAQPGPSTKRERTTDGHASAAQPGPSPGPSTKRERATDGHASAAQLGSATASSSSAASSDVCSAA